MRIKLMQGDCTERIKILPDCSVDLTITSPPYDSLRDYNGSITDWSYEKFQVLAKELYRVTKEGGVVVWVVGDQTVNGSETGSSFKQALYLKSTGFRLHDTMIYMKDNPPPVGGNKRYFQAFEYMFILSKGSPSTFNPIVEPRRNKWGDKRTSRVRPVTRNKAGVFTAKTVPVNQGMVKLQNIWSYTVSGGSVASDEYAHKHPAIFPEALVRDHIASWSNPGDTILDPFMGSGTTGKMALLAKRNFIGIEVNRQYYLLAKERIKNAYGNGKSQ